MIEIVATPGGEPSLRVDRRFVHSRRDPRTEARRFLDSQRKATFHGTIIIVGAGLGYLTEEARRAFPGSRVIALHLSPSCRANSVSRADATWDPSLGSDAGAFLLSVLAEEALPGLLTLFWRPALAAFPEVARVVEERVHHALTRLNAGVATTGYFGPRWFRNALANYLNIDTWCRLEQTELPVVVAAPGPSLSRVVPALQQARERFVLVAAASALLPLERAGVLPDLVVHQDGGYYSGEHLRHTAAAPQTAGREDRHGEPTERVVVQPLSARPLPGRTAPVVWLSYDHPADVLLRDHADSPYLDIGQLGTVTATATRLALTLTTGPVYLAGVDMATRDIISHIRGHSFEEYHLARSDRMSPLLTTLLARAVDREGADTRRPDGWRVAVDLEIYADWFTMHASEGAGNATAAAAAATDTHTGRLRRLEPSPVDLGIPSASLSDLAAHPPMERSRHRPGESRLAVRRIATPPRQERARRLDAALERWRGEVTRSISVTPGEPEVPGAFMRLPGEIRNLARHLALPEVLRVDRLERGQTQPNEPARKRRHPAENGELAEAYRELRDRLIHTIARMEEHLRGKRGRVRGSTPE
ncbi:MAG: 6-hydroxymethylpterin diphosphokinase MptE-like protein [bacterium]